jgi:hypothetical protein
MAMKLSLARGLLATSVLLPACSGGPNPEPPGTETAPSAAEPARDDDGDSSGPTAPTGLEGFCEHSQECGSTYYEDAEACVEASEGYWGACRRPELDAFGDCMMKVSCDDFNPDAFNPNATPCASEWKAIGSKDCD